LVIDYGDQASMGSVVKESYVKGTRHESRFLHTGDAVDIFMKRIMEQITPEEQSQLSAHLVGGSDSTLDELAGALASHGITNIKRDKLNVRGFGSCYDVTYDPQTNTITAVNRPMFE
jgi:ABC-type thiamine transport system substrate-binding protein